MVNTTLSELESRLRLALAGPLPGVEARISPSHRDIAVARTEVFLKPGEIKMLARPLEKHSMRAGPEGAIVTEYASYHDMKGLRFTHPKVKL